MSVNEAHDAEMREIMEGFLTESKDALTIVSSALEGWDKTNRIEIVKVVFRGVHSVKGGSGMFNFTEVAGFAHKFESVLAILRNGSVDDDTIEASFLLECTDQLMSLLEQSVAMALSTGVVSSDLIASPDLNDRLDFLLGKAPEPTKKIKTPEAASVAETPKPETSAVDDTMRIDRKAVDRIFNLSGELLVASNNLQVSRQAPIDQGQLNKAVDKVTSLAKQLQTNILGIRMVPVRQAFQKIPRIAREISRKLDKKIDLHFEGEETRLDKSLCEMMTDPLVHLIRNAIDHGLESTQERILKSKPEAGKIVVAARFESGKVVINISDDGRGIDQDAIFQKAVKLGWVKPEQRSSFTSDQIYDFLFKPGFSTAEKISDVSGRGVGLDVVRTNVMQMGGDVSIQSQLGVGTNFLLALPLTTGIKESLIVVSDETMFAVPIEQVLETVKIKKSDFLKVAGKNALRCRDEIIGVKFLSELLEMNHTDNSLESDGIALIFKSSDQKIAIIVEQIQSKQQVLLKPIPKGFKTNSLVQAFTYLANGEAILILDPLNYMNQTRPSRLTG
jgi:two-component system chemotaxis sensor kinase CheA